MCVAANAVIFIFWLWGCGHCKYLILNSAHPRSEIVLSACMFKKSRLKALALSLHVNAGNKMPLAQAHPFQPVPVKHEEDLAEVSPDCCYFASKVLIARSILADFGFLPRWARKCKVPRELSNILDPWLALFASMIYCVQACVCSVLYR